MPASLSAPPAAFCNFNAQAEPEADPPQTSIKAAPIACASKFLPACTQFLLRAPQRLYKGLCAYLISENFQSSIQFALGEFGDSASCSRHRLVSLALDCWKGQVVQQFQAIVARPNHIAAWSVADITPRDQQVSMHLTGSFCQDCL